MEVRNRTAVVAVAIYAYALFLFPSDVVLSVVGAQGFVAALVAMGLAGLWVVTTLLGLHDPRLNRHPIRWLVLIFAALSLVSFALVPFHGLPAAETMAADRWVILVASLAAVVVVTAEAPATPRQLVLILEATTWGAAFSGLVAALQWTLSLDIAGLVSQALPGFVINSEYSTYVDRGSLQRVTGTALHPIELGVVAGMMLPVAIALALINKQWGAPRRWLPAVLIALALPASVSRSAILSVLVAYLVFAILLPVNQRLLALLLLPVGLLLQFAVRPGYFDTFSSFVLLGNADPSVTTRLDDYAMVGRMVKERPLFGSGGGTYIAADFLTILDNQYLKSLVELGVVGSVGLTLLFVGPAIVGLRVRSTTEDEHLKVICGALVGAVAAAVVCSATFDSLSFSMFTGVFSLCVGAIGACWRLRFSASAAEWTAARGVVSS